MARSFDTKKRNIEKRKRKPVVIIVAEGKNVTEVQYLGSFNKQHGKYSIKAKNAGHDTDPQGLLKTAKKAWRDEELDINLGDKAYVFMDLDCSLMRASKIVEQEKKRGNVEFVLSNPCFEFWLLLHLMSADSLNKPEELAKIQANKHTSKRHTDVSGLVSAMAKHAQKIPERLFNKYYKPNLARAMNAATKFAATPDAVLDHVGTTVPLMIDDLFAGKHIHLATT